MQPQAVGSVFLVVPGVACVCGQHLLRTSLSETERKLALAESLRTRPRKKFASSSVHASALRIALGVVFEKMDFFAAGDIEGLVSWRLSIQKDGPDLSMCGSFNLCQPMQPKVLEL